MARWRLLFSLVVLPLVVLALTVQPTPAFQDDSPEPPEQAPTPTPPLPAATAAPPPTLTPAPMEPPDEGVPPEPEIDWSSIELMQDGQHVPLEPQDVPSPEADIAPPPAAPAAPATESTGTITHVVARGDNLTRIATRYGVSVEALKAINQLTNVDLIHVGQLILVPASGVTAAAAPATAAPASEPSAPSGSGDVYVVQRGDSVYKIARRYGTTVQAIVATNNLANPSVLYAGQQLLIPGGDNATMVAAVATPQAAAATATPEAAAATATPQVAGDGEAYVVKWGDTAYKIAVRFGTTVRELTAANNLANPNVLKVGQVLRIGRGGGAAAGEPAVTPAAAATEAVAAATVDPAAMAGSFVWPLQGRILNYYRYGHSAIDIEASIGTEIVAAAAGVIEFASWNTAGYGNLTIIDHGNGVRTLYAHQSAFLVEPGQQVEQGQVIGKSGSTGWSNWPHVHLEMIMNLRRVNPCGYLAGGC
jgi:murein DD-endopeptidase MepM/ murein hydrolase activator NlpD